MCQGPWPTRAIGCDRGVSLLPAAKPFIPPAIPWRQPRVLEPLPNLGLGLDQPFLLPADREVLLSSLKSLLLRCQQALASQG